MPGPRRGASARPGVVLAAAAMLAAVVTPSRGQPTRIIDLLTFGTPAGELTRVFGSSGDGQKGVPVAGGPDLDDDGFPDTAFAAVQASPAFGEPPEERIGAGEVIVVFGDGTLGGTLTTADFDAGLLKIAGEHAMEVAGVEIEIADVTGDGIGDLLIGRQNHTPEVGRPGAGALTILVGGTALRDHAETLAYLDLGDIPGTIESTTFIGAASYDRLGIWMRAGDVDGDGIDDIAVGADEVDQTASVTDNNGAVYVIRGGAHLAGATPTVDLADLGAEDFPDPLEGHVVMLEVVLELELPPESSAGYHFGATCQIGDLDGNGKGEVIAAAALNRSNAGIRLDGAPPGTGEATGGAPQGELFIAWDDNFPTDPWTTTTINLGAASESVTRIDGSPSNPSNGEFGEELLAGLDYDGDGKNDLFAGDLVGDGGNGFHSGTGHVIFNVVELKGMSVGVAGLIASPPAGVRHTLILGPSISAIGADTAIHGDYDGDGLGDLAMCNPDDSPQARGSAGTVHVIYGEVGGWPAVIDLAPADLPPPEAVRIVEIQGAIGNEQDPLGGGDTLCYSAAAGDVDEDGVPDLLINEMKGNGFEADGPDEGDQLDPAPDVGNLLLIGGAGLLERVLLDVDGDGAASPLTDGILILRFLDGFTGSALTDGAVGSGATRSGPEIELYLARAGAALDADGDDELEPLFDGLLALRYLFGFSGDVLVQGAIGQNATRTTGGEIGSFFDRLLPPP